MMKIIVNKDTFAKALQRAFDIDCHCISVYDKTMVFETKRYQEDFEYHIEASHNLGRFTIKFKNTSMVRLMDFLNSIPLQPLTISIDDDSCQVEHAIIRF